MDIRTGKTYDSREEALMAGVPESDIAKIKYDDSIPNVTFKSGPFKNRVYKRMTKGNLVRVS